MVHKVTSNNVLLEAFTCIYKVDSMNTLVNRFTRAIRFPICMPCKSLFYKEVNVVTRGMMQITL